ncbi:MAG: hypothetical protein FJ387_23920 [Verrucomicrobia bacterium]|nr:hypothetical protein [Verrucomicrobiota bacterium]
MLATMAWVASWLQTRVLVTVHRTTAPAGFAVGLVNGALMPMALPALALGKDVPIYAARNAGRTYKLGYTLGVNLCGAGFFGLLFWRLHRWRANRRGESEAGRPGGG